MKKIVNIGYINRDNSNAKKSLDKAISVRELLARIDNPDVKEQLSGFETIEDAYWWDIGVRNMELYGLSSGDVLIIRTGDEVRFAGEVLVVLNDEMMSLAQAIPWAGQPWRQPLLLRKVQYLEKN